MAAARESVETLLRELGRERSLRGRLGVLARGRALLARMSRSEREQVALRLGSRWAWDRIEKWLGADGELDESERLVGEAFERLGRSDPDELRRVARSLREDGGQGARDLLRITLMEALEEQAEVANAEAEAEPATEAHAGAAPVPPAAELEPELEPELQSPVEPLLEPQPEPSLLESELEPRLESAPVSPPEPMRTAAPAPDFEPVAAEVATRSGLERLRALRSLNRGTGEPLDSDGRRALLDSLGGGWASRRALSRWIAAGEVDLDEALGLIRRLERPGQRLWCLADLLARGDLDEAGRAAVLDAAPGDFARRRLAARAAQAGWRRPPPVRLSDE